MFKKYTLSDEEKLDWLRLIRSENVGPITFTKLLERFGSAKAALDAIPILAQHGGRKIAICSKAAAEDELSAAQKAGVYTIARCEPEYPPLLALVEDAPPLLHVIGHSYLLGKKAIAIVGARNASINGCRLAKNMAQELGENGILVVSGMARGIDTAAHKGALISGTVAVLAGGVDNIYPRENARLYEQLQEHGCILSEAPMGAAPQSRHFPSRNRIISGICRGVVVIEAAPKSGSLTTARFAGEQGHDVFAIPGSPFDARARGTNELIRQGATLVESAKDILEIICQSFDRPFSEPDSFDYHSPTPIIPDEIELKKARRRIIESLGSAPVDIDEILRITDFTPAVVLTVLLELELAGRLERHGANKVSLLG